MALTAAQRAVLNSFTKAIMGHPDYKHLFVPGNTDIPLGTELQDALDKAAAIAAENTDCEVGISLGGGVTEAGTWTLTMQAAGPRLRRTAGAGAADAHWVKVPDSHRTTASKGKKPTAVVVNYEVSAEAADDVRVELYKVVLGADGAARTRTLIAGGTDAHYDAPHDTAAERGAIASHRATMTIPVGSQAYLAVDEQLWVRFFANDATGNNAVVDITAAKLVYSETMNDLT